MSVDSPSEVNPLWKRIESRMNALGLNPFALANKAGLNGGYVRDIERGKVRSPSAGSLLAIAKALERDLYWLLGEPSPNFPPPPPPPPVAPLPDVADTAVQIIENLIGCMSDTDPSPRDVERKVEEAFEFIRNVKFERVRAKLARRAGPE